MSSTNRRLLYEQESSAGVYFELKAFWNLCLGKKNYALAWLDLFLICIKIFSQ